MLTDEDINEEIFFEFTTSPCSMDSFAKLFFSQQWTEGFLQRELHDIDIAVSHWEENCRNALSQQIISPNQPNLLTGKPTSLRRVVRSFHPSAISFPGLATHAENIKDQRLQLHQNGRRLTMREVTTLNGIPMSDYFVINMVWVIEEIFSEAVESSKCRVRIYIEIDFKKSTWFQGTIISNTKAELLSVCEKWKDCVIKDILEMPPAAEQASPLYKDCDLKVQTGYISDPVGMLWDEDCIYSRSEPTAALGAHTASPPPRSRNISSSSISSMAESSPYVDSEDDDAVFYDCQSDLPDIENAVLDNEEKRQLLSNRPFETNTSYRNMVIDFVDILFILFEFLYWQLHFFYQSDMKYFFDVPNTYDIAKRAFGSIVPKVSGDILQRPDLYGPSLCVFILPQVFLAAIDTSRHGCTRSSLLGNGTVVCVCMWAGLTVLLRILSFIMAPKLRLSQFACSIGYGFCAWGVSLSLSIIFDELSESPLALPPALPLVLIGLPAAVKQGLIFWEFTAPSPLKIQAHMFPIRLRGFVERNHAMLQYLVWAIPKLLALVVVTGTHYQCLWYLARVFLPGKQQQCRLSRLIQPSAYADILAQKELIRYAGELIKTGHVPPA